MEVVHQFSSRLSVVMMELKKIKSTACYEKWKDFYDYLCGVGIGEHFFKFHIDFCVLQHLHYECSLNALYFLLLLQH